MIYAVLLLHYMEFYSAKNVIAIETSGLYLLISMAASNKNNLCGNENMSPQKWLNP